MGALTGRKMTPEQIAERQLKRNATHAANGTRSGVKPGHKWSPEHRANRERSRLATLAKKREEARLAQQAAAPRQEVKKPITSKKDAATAREKAEALRKEKAEAFARALKQTEMYA